MMDYDPGEPLADFLIPGTPFRGLVLQGPYCYCAYVGVAMEHPLAGTKADDLFPVPREITFSAQGDGHGRPAGWWWWGWHYGEYGDFWHTDERCPPEMVEAADRMNTDRMRNNSPVWRWTIEEIVQHIWITAAVLSLALTAQSSDPPSVEDGRQGRQ